MNNFQVNHKFFSFQLKFSDSICKRNSDFYLIKKIPIHKLYARIVIKNNNEIVRHKIVHISKTPHYQYLLGDKKPYLDYLKKYGKSVGYTLEHSSEAFDSLISDTKTYLSKNYASNYIVCEKIATKFGKKLVIIDGVHRATILLKNKSSNIPVAIIYKNPKPPQLKQYINDFKNDFKEWYTPVKLGDFIINERTFPKYKERKIFLRNNERGESKWNYIIKKNLPQISGKTICDIGCNIGLYSIFFAKMGAIKIDGFDRSETVIQPTNHNLPKQSVVQQAYMVKNMYKLFEHNEFKNIKFYEIDIAQFDFTKIKYDLFFSCCVLYHFGDLFEDIIKKISLNIPEIFLQSNLGHTEKRIEKFASIEYHKWLLNKYGYDVKVDAPQNYNYPVFYGYKKL